MRSSTGEFGARRRSCASTRSALQGMSLPPNGVIAARGMDTVEANEELGFAADSRDYAFSAAALMLLGAKRVRLLSNNPDKVQQLEDAGIRVVERVPCRPRTSRVSHAYLETKRTKMGHFLEKL